MTVETTEIATRSRQSQRKVLAGENMLTPVKPFRYAGKTYEVDRDRFAPEHRLVVARPDLFRAAMEGDKGPEIQAFEERRRAVTGEATTTRGGPLYGMGHARTRGGREPWRIP